MCEEFKFELEEEVMFDGRVTKIIAIDRECDRNMYNPYAILGGINTYNGHEGVKCFPIRYKNKDTRYTRVDDCDLQKIPPKGGKEGFIPKTNSFGAVEARVEDSGEGVTLTTDNVLESFEKAKELLNDNGPYPKRETIPSPSGRGIPDHINTAMYQDLIKPFNPLQPTKMTKIDKHLKAKYFTDELIEETAELIEQAKTYEDSLSQLSVNVDRIISKVRDRIHDIKESVEDDDIENHRTELLELKSALKDLGSKDITTLLAISAKWTPKKETTIKSILPNQE